MCFSSILYLCYMSSIDNMTNNVLEEKLEDCINNNTELVNQLTNENINNNRDYIIYDGSEIKTCNIPEKYYIYC